MTPSQQQAKDMQDEARREQQADERIRELEKEVARLRKAQDVQARLLSWYQKRVLNAEQEVDALHTATKKAIALLANYQNRIDGPEGHNLAECINQLQSLHPEWDVDSGGDDS